MNRRAHHPLAMTLAPALLLAAALPGVVTLVTLFSAPALARVVPPSEPPRSGSEYDQLLQRYVDDQGRVDYARLWIESRPRVEQLYAAVAAHAPFRGVSFLRRGPARQEALAFYLNAYHLLCLKGVLDRATTDDGTPAGKPIFRPVSDERLRFFSFTRYVVAGERLSLDELSRRIDPLFADPRIPLSLSAGTRGGPRLPREAFAPDRVEAQLDALARRFVADRANVDYDPTTGRLRLSQVFYFHRDRLGKDPAALLSLLDRFRDPAETIPDRPAPAVAYAEYDWGLNDLDSH